MPKYAVYEKQSRVVVHEVEAENKYEATFIVQNKDLKDYSYVVEEDYTIENVELTET